MNEFLIFLVGAHAGGWFLVARRVQKHGFIDLCQFVREFIYSPFILSFFLALVTMWMLLFWKCIIPNFLSILTALAIIFGTVCILGALGYFVISPAVKKVHGIAKPFSEKLCIVLYRAKK